MRSRVAFRCAIVLLASAVFATHARAEEPAPTPPVAPPKAPTVAEIKAWIAQLGDQDFEKRTAAQSALLKAGTAALPELKAAQESADPEIRNRAADLMRKLKWTSIPTEIGHLKLFPDRSIYLVHFGHVSKSVESARASAIGKMMVGEDLKPLTDFVTAKINAELAKGGQGPVILEALKKLNGQATGALWNLDVMQLGTLRAALIVDLPADSADALYKGFLKDTGLFEGGPTTDEDGLAVLNGPRPANLPPGFEIPTGAVALAGNHMILGANLESVKEVAAGLIKPDAGNLADSTLFKKIEPHLGDRHDLLFVMNAQAYLDMAKKMPGMNMGEALGQMGYDGMEMIAWNTAIRGDIFEDRYVLASNEKLAGLSMGKLYELAWASTKPLKEKLGMAPARSVAVAQNFMDGSVVYDFTTEYLKSMSKIQQQAGLPGFEVAQSLEQIEAATGLKISELAGCVKGEMITWAEIAADDDAQPLPDLGIRIECVDEAKAKQLAEGLFAIMQKAPGLMLHEKPAAPPPGPPPGAEAGKGDKTGEPAPTDAAKTEPPKEAPPKEEAPKAEPPKETVKKIERDGRVYYTESSESPFVTEVKARQALPYRLSLSAQGASLLVGSSAPYLNRRISQLEKKEPGLDPAKFLPADVNTDEIKSFFALDLGELAEFGAKLGLPILSAQLENQPDLQEKVAALAQKKGVFKKIPPLTIAAGAPKNGVTVSTIRSPVPPIPAMIFAGVLFGMSRRGHNQAPPPPPEQVQPPAPGF